MQSSELKCTIQNYPENIYYSLKLFTLAKWRWRWYGNDDDDDDDDAMMFFFFSIHLINIVVPILDLVSFLKSIYLIIFFVEFEKKNNLKMFEHKCIQRFLSQ